MSKNNDIMGILGVGALLIATIWLFTWMWGSNVAHFIFVDLRGFLPSLGLILLLIALCTFFAYTEGGVTVIASLLALGALVGLILVWVFQGYVSMRNYIAPAKTTHNASVSYNSRAPYDVEGILACLNIRPRGKELADKRGYQVVVIDDWDGHSVMSKRFVDENEDQSL